MIRPSSGHRIYYDPFVPYSHKEEAEDSNNFRDKVIEYNTHFMVLKKKKREKKERKKRDRKKEKKEINLLPVIKNNILK